MATNKDLTLAESDAPFVYFEGVPVYGVSDGVARVTLVADRLSSHDGAVQTECVAVAHLRMSLPAMRRLRAALDSIDLMLSRAPGPTN